MAELISGETRPTASPHGQPQTKPQRITGRCMGRSILPKSPNRWKTWGRSREMARNMAE
jgi:hypothetical protein